MDDRSLRDIDDLIALFFSIFDNRAQRTPDWSALSQVFLSDAVISRCDGDSRETMALQEFISPREAMLTGGSLVEFHEWETEAKTFVSGVTATRICRYEKEGRLNGEPYAGRGAKSIQMTRTPEGWRILSILWEDDA